MIDFNIVWSVVFAVILVRIVDNAVEYVHYQVTKKKRNKLFEELLAEIELIEPSKKKTVKKAAPKRKTR